MNYIIKETSLWGNYHNVRNMDKYRKLIKMHSDYWRKATLLYKIYIHINLQIKKGPQ